MGKLLVVTILTNLFISYGYADEKVAPKVIKWKIAHAPKEYFEHTAKEFKKRIEKRTHGRVQVKIESVLFDKENHDFKAQVQAVRDNKVQMSQVYLSQLYNVQPDFQALNLPFIFQDDRHVDQVVDGKIGKRLLAGIQDQKIEGMSFTYSGGFINVVTNKEIKSVGDFRELKYRAFGYDLNNQIHKILQTDYVNEYSSVKNENKRYLTIDKMFEEGVINAGDATSNDAKWAVFDTKKNKATHLVKTRHFVLLTTLVINRKFVESLNSKDQEIVRATAREVSKLERDYVVRDGLMVEEKLAQAGVKITSLPKKEQLKLKHLLKKKVYPRIKVSKGLIKEIEKSYSPEIVSKY